MQFDVQQSLTDLREVLDRRFRASSTYRIVAHEELPEHERDVLSELAQDSSYYGVLIPDSRPQLGIRAIDHDAARLLAELREPGPLPLELRDERSPAQNRRVAMLVLDEVLEMECEQGFRSGVEAHREILLEPLVLTAGRDKITRISEETLERAQSLPINSPRHLCAWIYAGGTLPVGPVALRELRNWESVCRAVGIEDGTASSRVLDRSYRFSARTGWGSWHHVERRLSYLDGSDEKTAYKLYVSPMPHALSEVVPVVVEAALNLAVPAFKLGNDAYGLYRPDKLVLYFDDERELRACSDHLLSRLAEVPAQGVPFTAPLVESGLLSWGVDPPRAHRAKGWQDAESWRSLITARLARSILLTKSLPAAGVEPWIAALERLRVEGIDTTRWLPGPAQWNQERHK